MAISDRPDWHDNDEEILAFQEDYPDVYEFVLKVLDGNFDDPILQAFEDDYGEAYLEGFLKIISGKASEKDIQEFREEFGDDSYNAIVKMIRKRNPVIEGAPEEELDEAGWEKLKPQFIKIYQETERAGNSAKTFVQLVLKSFGVKVKPYLSHFMREVRDGKIDVRAEHKIEPIKSPLRREKFKKGDFIGQKYEVFDVLGEGGFGIVYLVYSHETKSAYALKTFLDKYLEDVKTRDRFQKEAQVWIDLERHPYLVRAFVVEEISGRLYIAMEHIASDEPGMNTLDGFLRRRPPDLAQSLRWAIQFCYSMEYAYSKGVKAHRDIKPANIMIDQNKTVRISDFGLAGIINVNTISEQGKVAETSGNDSSMQTAIGESFGTPEYMSPEQFTDLSACDERSDIYSFGIVLYRMASGGKLPFYTDNPTLRWEALKYFHQETLVPRLKSPFFPIIFRCLEKKPINRYFSFKELRRDLESLLKEQAGEIVKLPELKELESWELLNKGYSLATLSKYQEAIACYDRALEIEPRYAEAWNNKGNALGSLGKPQEAIACFDRAFEINPGHDGVWMNKGIALGSLGKPQEAIACYDRALEINPRHADTWMNKGNALGRLGKPQEAIACYDRAIEINPSQVEAWTGKGFVLGSLGKPQEEIACYDRAIEINPRHDGVWIGKGLALYNLGKSQEAIACFDKGLEINPSQVEAWINKGAALGSLGKSQEAIACFDKGLEINPKDAMVWHNKGIALGMLGKPQEAIACFDRALEINPKDAEAWYNKGGSLVTLGKFQEAIACFDRAIQINPRHADAWYVKGAALGSLGKSQEEIACYDRAIEINPRHAEVWYVKGAALGSLGKSQEEIACYDRAIEINPKHAMAWYNRGVELGSLGKSQEAIACYDRAIEINPRHAEAWCNKALAEDKLNRIQDAISSYKHFLKLAPELIHKPVALIGHAAHARKRLKELEGK